MTVCGGIGCSRSHDMHRIQQLLDHSKPDPSMFGALPPGAHPCWPMENVKALKTAECSCQQ